MKKILLSITMLLFIGLATTDAQPYSKAIGAKVYPLGVTYKQFVGERHAFEIVAHFAPLTGYRWLHAGANYHYHFPIGSIDGFSWFLGGGAFLRSYSYTNDYNGSLRDDLFIGINFSGGVDYKFQNIPLNLAADWAPGFALLGNDLGFVGEMGGVAARYTF